MSSNQSAREQQLAEAFARLLVAEYHRRHAETSLEEADDAIRVAAQGPRSETSKNADLPTTTQQHADAERPARHYQR